MIIKKVQIINKLGLHARASSKMVDCAAKFSAVIMIKKNNRAANAKSIMSLMMLAASVGSEVEISCDGVDENEAMEAICKLINDKFQEGQ